jgi:hypothetical protein
MLRIGHSSILRYFCACYSNHAENRFTIESYALQLDFRCIINDGTRLE